MTENRGKKDNPFHISFSLKKIKKQLELTKQKKLVDVKMVMTEVLPPALMERIAPVLLRKNVLHIAVDDSVASYELLLHKTVLINKLNSAGLKYKIDDIKIKFSKGNSDDGQKQV